MPNSISLTGNVTRVTEFWMAVRRGEADECWPWEGYVNRDGYGEFYWDGRMVGAHELALSFATGELRLPELDTCHSCDTPLCCNPAHLRFDTRASNVADMVAHGRTNNARKLSDDDVRLIRRFAAFGCNQAILASRLGVSPATISMIVHNKRRKLVDA
jgi:hypothetical protein